MCNCLLPLQHLNLLFKREVRYESKTFLNLSYRYITRSLTHLCSYIFITSLRQKRFSYLVHLLSSLNFRSFRVLVMFLLKLSTKPHTTIICISLQYYEFSIMGGKYIKEQGDLFLMKSNVCLSASTPAFIVPTGWVRRVCLSNPVQLIFFKLSKTQYLK